jgi:phosphoglucosamine mutase
VLLALEAFGDTLHNVKAGMQKLPQTMINVRLESRITINEQPLILAAVSDAEAQLEGSGRVLLRASGTEPVIRVMVEGKNSAQVNRLAADLAEVVKSAIQP